MEVTLLTLEQVYGKNENSIDVGVKRLKIFEKYGMTAAVTDFAILLGNTTSLYTNSDGRIGKYWLKTQSFLNLPLTIDTNGGRYVGDCKERNIGIRPVISFSEIKSNYSYNIIKKENDILEIEFGYYPQAVVSKKMQEELNKALLNENIFKTGNTYTTDLHACNRYDLDFSPCTYFEYEYKNKKYVRIKAMSCYADSKFDLSNNEKYKNRVLVWVEVEPIKWLVDLKTDIMAAKKIIVSGIQFDREINYNGIFESTDMYKYLNTHFIKDIQQNIPKEIELKIEYEKSKQEIELENIEKTKQKILNLRKNINL